MYTLYIGRRSRKVGRFIGHVRHCLREAFVESEMSYKELIDRLEIDESIIKSVFDGTGEISLRMIGDIAWALDVEIYFSLKNEG